MRLYKHTGAGHYIGSLVILFANNQDEANLLIRDELDHCGLKDEPLNVITVPQHSTIVHVDDGDY